MDGNHFASSDVGTKEWYQRARHAVTFWTIAGIAAILLLSCANSTSTQGTTSQQKTVLSSNRLSTTATPQLTQQYEFTERDSGRTVIFTVTSRFGIQLNHQKYPKKNMLISCTPTATLGSVSNLPAVMPPLYAVRYEAVQTGSCTIKNGSFLLQVMIIALNE